MRSSMRTEWIKSQNIEMQGLWSSAYFKRYCAPPSVLKIQFSAPAFTIKLRARGANLTNVKLRLVAQAQHMKWQNTDGVGDYDNAFSPVPAASGFRTILRLATQLDMFTDYVDISQ